MIAGLVIVSHSHAASKDDIQGFRIGMTMNQVHGACLQSHPGPMNGAPGFVQAEPSPLHGFYTGPYECNPEFILYFTSNLTGNRLYSVEYRFCSSHTAANLNEEIEKQYGLSHRALTGNDSAYGEENSWKLSGKIVLKFSVGISTGSAEAPINWAVFSCPKVLALDPDFYSLTMEDDSLENADQQAIDVYERTHPEHHPGDDTPPPKF